MNKPVKMKKCVQCKDPFPAGNSLIKVCSMACALDYGKCVVATKKEKANKAQKKAFLDNDKSFQRAKAQRSFNEFIRLRDSDLGCVSCDKPSDWGGQWHASHWKSRGSRPDLAFNEDNVHKACSQCNLWLSGNPIPYRVQLVLRIGEDRVQCLEKDHGSTVKYDAIFYKEMHKKYQNKLKDLSRQRILQ